MSYFYLVDDGRDKPIIDTLLDMAPKYGVEFEAELPDRFTGFVGDRGICVEDEDVWEWYPAESNVKWVTTTLHTLRARHLL